MSDYYSDQNDIVLSGNWILFDLGFTADNFLFSNDDNSSRDLGISWDGVDRDFILKGEYREAAVFNQRRRNKVYMKCNDDTVSGIPYRLSAWSKN